MRILALDLSKHKTVACATFLITHAPARFEFLDDLRGRIISPSLCLTSASSAAKIVCCR